MKCLILSLVSLVLLNTTADARRRGFAIIGWGEDLSEVADLPDEEFGEANLGLHYSSFDLFFVPIITWDKKHVLIFPGDQYADLEKKDLEVITRSTGSLAFKGNLWTKYVNYLWPLLIALYFVRRILIKRKLRQIDEEYAHLHE